MGKKKRKQRTGDGHNGLDELLRELWDALGAGDVLHAEMATAETLAIFRYLSDADEEPGSIVVNLAMQGRRTPEDAALLRLTMLLGSPAVRRKASQGLGDLTADGVYPPDWVTQAGKPEPVRAVRRYDILGDDEAVVVIYRYGEREHAIIVDTSLIELPVADVVGLVQDASGLPERLAAEADEFDRLEEISLAEARQRIEPALGRAEDDRYADPDLFAYLPIVRSRVRRLPADGAPQVTEYTAADRAAAVADFLASPFATEAIAADADATRLWAEILTASSSLLPGTPPAQIGPIKLGLLFAGRVPDTYPLTQTQRAHLKPAVTAWLAWSAQARGLDDKATAALTADLDKIAADFTEDYDDPPAATARAYTADIATGDTDLRWLDAQVERRTFAVPLREGEPPDIDARTEEEFGGCEPPAGASRSEFLTAARRVTRELWSGDPPATWERAQELLGKGMDRHDVIHTLTEAPRASV